MSIPSSTPAGWYPDPAGTANQRYWDGAQWTEHLAQPQPLVAAPIVQPELPEGARVNSPFIWIVVLLPLVSIIIFSVWNFQAYLQLSISSPTTAGLSQFANPGYLLVQFGSFLVIAANVLLSYFDWRALKRVGVVRPFHWAWSFLNPVYIVGRTVVLRRRVHRGLAPLFVYIVVYLVTTIFILVRVFTAVAAVVSTIGNIPNT